jgi:hypothetical protein
MKSNIYPVLKIAQQYLFLLIKAGLNNGNCRSKLVHFEAQKIFSMFKKALA